MLVKPSFDEVQDEVSPGTYKGIIKKAEVKEWPNGGQYINWELETFGEQNPKNNGRRIFYKTSTSGKGAFLLQRFYKAAVGQALTGSFETDQLLGKKVEVDIVDGVDRRTGTPSGYTDVKAVRAIAMN